MAFIENLKSNPHQRRDSKLLLLHQTPAVQTSSNDGPIWALEVPLAIALYQQPKRMWSQQCVQGSVPDGSEFIVGCEFGSKPIET